MFVTNKFLTFNQIKKLYHFNKNWLFDSDNIKLIFKKIKGNTEEDTLKIYKFLFDKHIIEKEVYVKFATKNGHFELVKFLLPKFKEYKYVLEIASKYGNLEIVKFILEIYNHEHVLDQQMNLEMLKKLTTEYSVDYGRSLMLATEHGHLEVIKLLIANGLHSDQDSALKHASRNGHLEIVKVLIENGANVNIDDYPLTSASLHGHLEVVKFLLQNINPDYFKINPNVLALSFRYASSNGHLEIVKLLKNLGANIHAHKDYALREAITNNHLEVVKFLIKHGNYKSYLLHRDIWDDRYEFSYFVYLASEKDYSDIVEFLLEYYPLNDIKIKYAIKHGLFHIFDEKIILEETDEDGLREESIFIREGNRIDTYIKGIRVASAFRKTKKSSCVKCNSGVEEPTTKEIKHVKEESLNDMSERNFLWACENNSFKIIKKIRGEVNKETLIDGLDICYKNNHQELFKYILINNSGTLKDSLNLINKNVLEFEHEDQESFLEIVLMI